MIFAKQNKPEEHKPRAIINVKEPQYPQIINWNNLSFMLKDKWK